MLFPDKAVKSERETPQQQPGRVVRETAFKSRSLANANPQISKTKNHGAQNLSEYAKVHNQYRTGALAPANDRIRGKKTSNGDEDNSPETLAKKKYRLDHLLKRAEKVVIERNTEIDSFSKTAKNLRMAMKFEDELVTVVEKNSSGPARDQLVRALEPGRAALAFGTLYDDVFFRKKKQCN